MTALPGGQRCPHQFHVFDPPSWHAQSIGLRIPRKFSLHGAVRWEFTSCLPHGRTKGVNWSCDTRPSSTRPPLLANRKRRLLAPNSPTARPNISRVTVPLSSSPYVNPTPPKLRMRCPGSTNCHSRCCRQCCTYIEHICVLPMLCCEPHSPWTRQDNKAREEWNRVHRPTSPNLVLDYRNHFHLNALPNFRPRCAHVSPGSELTSRTLRGLGSDPQIQCGVLEHVNLRRVGH